MLHKFPQANEKMSTRELQSHASALRALGKKCQERIEAAKQAFSNEAEQQMGQARAAMGALAKQALRRSGEVAPRDLDGPAWERIDQICQGRLGVMAAASREKIEKQLAEQEEARTAQAAMESAQAAASAAKELPALRARASA